MITLHIMCGPQASGKSTFAKKHSGFYISRDEIRNELITPEEKEIDYFAKEDEVFTAFVNRIIKAIELNVYEDIYVDATHLNKKSRNKLISTLNNALNINTFINIQFECMSIPLHICLQQNAARPLDERVPDEVLINAYKRYHIPDEEEMIYYVEHYYRIKGVTKQVYDLFYF